MPSPITETVMWPDWRWKICYGQLHEGDVQSKEEVHSLFIELGTGFWWWTQPHPSINLNILFSISIYNLCICFVKNKDWGKSHAVKKWNWFINPTQTTLIRSYNKLDELNPTLLINTPDPKLS